MSSVHYVTSAFLLRRIMSSELVSIQPDEPVVSNIAPIEGGLRTPQILVANSRLTQQVKTTSLKKYCVKPNAGVIKLKATFDFTVTMQAQNLAAPDLQCKDKFLIQSTVVPFGQTEEDIKPGMLRLNLPLVVETIVRVAHFSIWQFPKDSGRGIRSETAIEDLRVTNDVEPTPAEDGELKIATSSDPSFFDDVVDFKFHKEIADKLANEVEELTLKIDVLGSKLAESAEVACDCDKAKIPSGHFAVTN
ncbi:hypothetical protein Ancab_030523 [Ancistrocladus abbreviatus]